MIFQNVPQPTTKNVAGVLLEWVIFLWGTNLFLLSDICCTSEEQEMQRMGKSNKTMVGEGGKVAQ